MAQNYPPAKQWWVVNGETLLNALTRAAAAEDPTMLYLEMYANSRVTYDGENGEVVTQEGGED